MSNFSASKLSMGWLPDYPDFRDITIDSDDVSRQKMSLGQNDSVKKMIAKTGAQKTEKSSITTSVSLIKWFSPIENQGSLGSCTANAGVGLVEYFERRAFGKHVDASRLFLYKATRNLSDY